MTNLLLPSLGLCLVAWSACGGTSPRRAIDAEDVLLRDTIVEAGGYAWATARVDSASFDSARRVSLAITYSVLDDGEVIVLVLNEDGFFDLQRGLPPATFLQTDKTNAGSFDVRLPRPGLYYTVFDNRGGEQSIEVEPRIQLQFEH